MVNRRQETGGKKQEAGGKKQEARNRRQEARNRRQETKGRKQVIRNYRDLEVYKLSYDLAMEIFWLSKKFPREEKYSLVSQMRNSSRSIPANIGEGWAKRSYENVFKRHLMDAIGSCDEIRIWLNFSHDCGYISKKEQERFTKGYDEAGKMLSGLFEKWQTFAGSKE